MGKASRRKRTKDHVEEAHCPVCFEVIADAAKNDLPDNALSCPRGHLVCTRCVAKLVVPTKKCSPACIGFQFSCPLCRAEACVSKLHLMVLAKNSWRTASAMFPCANKMETWANEL